MLIWSYQILFFGGEEYKYSGVEIALIRSSSVKPSHGSVSCVSGCVGGQCLSASVFTALGTVEDLFGQM